MAIEEKAKAYDEAMNKIKPLYEQAKRDGNPIWSTYEYLIPELRESEDERMRKAILAAIRQGLNTEKALAKYNVTYDDVEAYLENQKEHKHAPDDLQKSFEAGQTSIVDNPEQYGLCKKPAWSEEDEEMRNLIIAIFEVNHPDGFFKANELGTADMRGVHTEEIISWLKSIRPVKQEWSEEDEKMLNELITIMDGGKVTSGTYLSEYAAWLKSLRPQPKRDCKDCAMFLNGKCTKPHWKPSEEHLSALLAVFNDPNNIGSQTCQLALTDLYEQLKKL